MSSKPPGETQEARLARLAQRDQIGRDRAKNRGLRELVKVANKRSGLLGGAESGLGATLGVGVPGTPAGRS